MKDQFRFNLDRFELEIDVQPPTREQILIAVAWIAGSIATVLFVILCLRLIAHTG